MTEETVLIESVTPMVGVVTQPEPGSFDASRPAVLILNAGLTHRPGPARLSVKLARRLADRGFVVLRYDSSGIGDTPTRLDGLPLDQAGIAETRDAMDFLHRTRGIESFVLMGLCSGAVFSFSTALDDPRVTGLALLNARGLDHNASWQLEIESRSWTRHYLDRILRPHVWWRALTGKSDYGWLLSVIGARLKGLMARRELSDVASGLGSEMQQLIDRGVATLWLSSKDDSSLDYLAAIEQEVGALSLDALRRHNVVGANHTFTQLVHQEEVLDTVDAWCCDRWPNSAAPDLRASA